jgi:hypothetical protein
MNGVEKAAKKLKDSLSKSSDTAKESKLKEKDAKVWNKYFTAINKYNTVKMNFDNKLITWYTANENGVTTLNGVLLKAMEIIDGYKEISGDVTKAKGEIKKKFNKLVGEGAMNKAGVSGFNTNDEKALYLPITFVNDKAKCIEVNMNDDDENPDVKFKITTITTNETLDGDVAVIAKTDLNTKIESLVTMAKGLKSFSDKRIKEIDDLYKELDKMADNKGSNAVDKILLKMKASYGTNVRALVAGAYLDSVLGYSAATKKLLAYYRDHAAMYNNNEL